MKRFLSSWQGLVAGLIAVALYLLSPALILAIDPTAGFDDAGTLQWILLATAQAFWGIFVAWLAWQIAFRSMDRWADTHLRSTFEALPGWAKLLAVQVSYIAMLMYWIACLLSQPRV